MIDYALMPDFLAQVELMSLLCFIDAFVESSDGDGGNQHTWRKIAAKKVLTFGQCCKG